MTWLDTTALARVTWAELVGLGVFLVCTHYIVFMLGYTRGNAWAVHLLERKKRGRGE